MRQFFCISFLCLGVIVSYSQHVLYNDTTQRLYFCISNSGPEFAKILKKAGDRNEPYFTNADIDPENTGRLNKEALKKSIDHLVPNKNFSGILTLDWEAAGYNRLKRDTNVTDRDYNRTIDAFLEVLKYAKKLRPKAQWGFYDIPISIYFVNVSNLWKARIDRMDRLLRQCDVLMPCMYDYFPTGYFSASDDSAYLIQTLAKALEKGAKFKKPVMAFIWHRYWDGIEKDGLKAIDPSEYLHQLRLMANVEYKGKKINGVIWWHEDLYYINVKAKNIMAEMGNTPRDEYRDNVLLKYYNIACKVFKDE